MWEKSEQGRLSALKFNPCWGQGPVRKDVNESNDDGTVTQFGWSDSPLQEPKNFTKNSQSYQPDQKGKNVSEQNCQEDFSVHNDSVKVRFWNQTHIPQRKTKFDQLKV